MQAKNSPPKAISFALSEFHSFNFLCNTKHSFLCGFPSGRLPRVVCFALDQSIVASDKCLSYAFILLSPKSTKVSFGDPFFARNDIFLSASRRRHIAFAKGKNIASSLLRALYSRFFAKEKPSEIRTVFCCLDLLFFVEKCFVDIIAFC